VKAEGSKEFRSADCADYTDKELKKKNLFDRIYRIIRIILLLCQLPDEANRKQSACG